MVPFFDKHIKTQNIIPVVLAFALMIPACKDKDEGPIAKDSDGNVYSSTTIGDQIWMTENLKATKFNDGSGIPLVTDHNAWIDLSTPGYSWYDNDEEEYADPYGGFV